MRKHLTTPMDSYWFAVFYSHPLIIWYKKQDSIMELVNTEVLNTSHKTFAK